MRMSAASAELNRQVTKSRPAAHEPASEEDAQLGFFRPSLSRRSSLRHIWAEYLRGRYPRAVPRQSSVTHIRTLFRR